MNSAPDLAAHVASNGAKECAGREYPLSGFPADEAQPVKERTHRDFVRVGFSSRRQRHPYHGMISCFISYDFFTQTIINSKIFVSTHRMVLGPDLYGGFMLLTVLPAAYLIRLFWQHRDRPSGRWFVVTLTGMGGWAFFWGLMLLFGSYTLSIASFNLVLLFASVTAVGWLFVSVEYVRQTKVGSLTVLPFLLVPAA
ncbi:MAG: histidine kinase N-terminal 7TM domain-containing protein, partial [Bradymonadaceae bacterium]